MNKEIFKIIIQGIQKTLYLSNKLKDIAEVNINLRLFPPTKALYDILLVSFTIEQINIIEKWLNGDKSVYVSAENSLIKQLIFLARPEDLYDYISTLEEQD